MHRKIIYLHFSTYGFILGIGSVNDILNAMDGPYKLDTAYN